MQTFKTKIDGVDDDREYNFITFDNTEPIEIGDAFIFFFAGIADVQICDSESVKFEINENVRVKDERVWLDLVSGFWRNCYKIKTTDFDLKSLGY